MTENVKKMVECIIKDNFKEANSLLNKIVVDKKKDISKKLSKNDK